jgi:imidazolonepropionase-like amidohydrolase
MAKVMTSGGMLTTGTDLRHSQLTPSSSARSSTRHSVMGYRVTAHAHALDAIADAVAAGVDGIEHCSFLTPEGVRTRHDFIAAIVSRHIAIGASVGLALVPLVAPPPELTPADARPAGHHLQTSHLVDE